MNYSTSGLSPVVQDYGLVSFGSTVIYSTSSLSEGTYTYYFGVIFSSGQIYYDSVEVEVWDISAPTGFTASTSDSTLTLGWDTVSGADGYNIYYGLSSGDYSGPLDLGNTTGLSLSGIPSGNLLFSN